MGKEADGIVVTGVAALDQVLRRFGVQRAFYLKDVEPVRTERRWPAR